MYISIYVKFAQKLSGCLDLGSEFPGKSFKGNNARIPEKLLMQGEVSVIKAMSVQ